MAPRILQLVRMIALASCLIPQRAGAQIHIPEPGRPVCVVAFCPSGSKHPGKKIDCSDDGMCSCFDSCGGGTSSSSSGGSNGGGGGRLLTAAVLGVAKVVSVIAAPGHAVEALSAKRTTAAEARQQFQEQQAAQRARAEQGRNIAIEAEALRQFRRAVSAREENPHRYLRPLFEKTPAAPRMNAQDSLQQLRCIDQAMQSAVAAANSGIAGDISFLDARRAVDIASGAWDSGLAPAGCGGESLAAAAARSAAERQQLLGELVQSVQAQAELRIEVQETQVQLEVVEKKGVEAKKSFAAEQEQRIAPLQQAVDEAKKDAAEKQRALQEESTPEPPPAGVRSKPTDKPQNPLWEKLRRAKAEADAHVEDAGQKLAQVKTDIAAATKDFDSQVAAELNVAKARVSAAEQRLNAASAATNERLAQLGIPSPPSAGQGDGR